MLGAEEEAAVLSKSDDSEGKPSAAASTALPDLEAEKPDPPKADYRAQIVEQLGGPERAEVRYLALSDDSSEMVVSLKVTDAEGEEKLIEVFFERDNFGRYLSTGDSPLESQLTLWTD